MKMIPIGNKCPQAGYRLIFLLFIVRGYHGI